MNSLTDKAKFVRRVFGKFTLARNGIDAAVRCPSGECGSRGDASKRKLVIRLDSDVFHCWVCGIKGRNLAPLLKKYASTADLQFYIENFKGEELLTGDVEEAEEILKLPGDFRMLALVEETKDPDLSAVLSYVRSRGLTDRDLWYFKLGASNERGMRRRVICPSFSHSGDLNYFVARAVDNGRKPKYVNARVDRWSVIFNDLNIDWTSPLTLVEGPFDLMKCDDNTTCLLGSDLSERSALFQKIVTNLTPVILALDSDMMNKTQKIAKRLSDYGIAVRIAPLGKYSDVGEMTKKEFLNSKRSAQLWTHSDMIINKIQSITSGCFV